MFIYIFFITGTISTTKVPFKRMYFFFAPLELYPGPRAPSEQIQKKKWKTENDLQKILF